MVQTADVTSPGSGNNRFMKQRILPAVILAMGLTLAGCAGADEPTAVDGSALTEAQINVQLDAIEAQALQRGTVTHSDVTSGVAIIEAESRTLGGEGVRRVRQKFLSRMNRLSYSLR